VTQAETAALPAGVYRPIPLDEFIASLPEDEQKEIAEGATRLVGEFNKWSRRPKPTAPRTPEPEAATG